MAKASGMVCLRLPPEDGQGKRFSKVWEAGATIPEVEAVAGELLAAGVELVSMESTSDYWRAWFVTLEAAGLQVQLVNASQARNIRPAKDGQGGRAVDRAADRDGDAAPELRAAAGDPGAAPATPASCRT